MNKDKHIPQGYKESPLGIIPKEWEVKRLGDIADIGSGGTPSKSRSEYWGGTIPWITTSLLNKPYIDSADVYITEEGLNNSSAKMLDAGVLLMAMYGQGQTRGKVAKLQISASTNQACAYINVNMGLVDYVHQYLIAHYENIRKVSNDGNQKNLSLGLISNIQILFPPILEQKKILNILCLWDTAIEKQSELIEKLKLRKRALMQQLLTGKNRLPGFSGEWKEVKLGDVSNFLRNNTLSREQLNDDDGVINNIHYGDVLIKYPSIIDCRKEKLQYINDGVSILTDYVENGDVIMSDTAEDETVGRVCEVQNVGNKKILAGLHTMLIRPHDKLFAPYYLGYYLNSEAYHKQLIPLIQGIKVCSIGKVAVQNTVLRIPSLEEQRIIASVLVKADKGIELAKEKLANLQSQKRGLMQQLLTGKKRINS